MARRRPRRDRARDQAPLEARRRGVRGVRAADGRDGALREAAARRGRAARSAACAIRAACFGLAGFARRFAALPEPQQTAFIQLLTMSSADFVSQWFETEALRATLSASGIIGTFLSPRTPGSAYILLHHYMGEVDGEYRAWGLPVGGTGAISRAIAAAAHGAGRRAAHVCAGGADHDAATAARRASCSSRARRSRHASSSRAQTCARPWARCSSPARCPPTTTPQCAPTSSADRRARSTSRWTGCRLSAALPPGTTDVYRGMVSISPSIDYLERAYDDAVDGRFSRAAVHRHRLPELHRSVRRAAGQARHGLLRAVRAVRAGRGHLGRPARGVWRHGPGDDREVRARPAGAGAWAARSLTPLDIERTFGLTEGNIFQGELLLEQLFSGRPMLGSGYATPVRDLWLCGSSTHPGGAISGAPGRNAAVEVLRTLRGPATRRGLPREVRRDRHRRRPQRARVRRVPGPCRLARARP